MTNPGHVPEHRHLIAALLLALATTIITVSAAKPAAGDSPDRDRVADGGHVILLRHALAPGTGDPPDFELGDCSTQRNLNDAGRKQAERIGERLRRAGLGDAPVFTSQWCRCQDTAEELDLGEPRVLEALNSFYGRRDQREQRVSALREFLAERRDEPTAVLVAHQVNITAATDVFPASGEAVVARIGHDGSLEVVDTMTTPAPER